MNREVRPGRACRASAAILLALTAACGGGEDAAAQPVRTEARDSAGVTIVRHTGDVPPQAWRIGPEPLLTLGGVPDDSLKAVAGAVRLPDGGIAVANTWTEEIRWYDARGRFVRTVGGEGEEPGKFEYLTWIGARGDSVVAWDQGAGRLSVFDPAGRLARHVSPPEADHQFAHFRGIFPDGSFVFSYDVRFLDDEPLGTIWRPAHLYYRVDANGATLDTLGYIDDIEVFEAKDSEGEQHGYGLPFGRETSVAVGDGVWYVGAAEGWQYEERLPDGRVTMIVRRDHAPLRVTRAERDEYQRRSMEMVGRMDPEYRQELLDQVEANLFPETHPPYEQLLLDAEGRVWVRETLAPDESLRRSQYSVFDADGRWIARVDAPARFQPMHIGADWILGRHLDDEGTERIRLHRVQAAPAPPAS